ncbi:MULTISPECIES: hypothetical protein [unclassified Campylobacter]|nr:MULTISPECIES: hypothetical protein [unclassified Campylobacter]
MNADGRLLTYLSICDIMKDRKIQSYFRLVKILRKEYFGIIVTY